IELQNADNITFDHLTITGGLYGIYASTTSDSDFLTVTNSVFQGNSSVGLYIETSNDRTTLTNSTFDSPPGGSQNYHALVYGNDVVVSNNIFSRCPNDALLVKGARSLVSDNQFVNNRIGIDTQALSGALADRITVRNNYVTGSSSYGVLASSNALFVNNEVTNSAIGMQLSGNSEVRENIIHDNGTGIFANSGELIVNNRVYHNTNYGISLGNAARATQNRVYDNFGGIYTNSTHYGLVDHNLIYQNTLYGVVIDGSVASREISNNVVYQSNGDAIHVQNSTQNISILNNILVARNGYLISVNPDSERGFRSDYNILYATDNGKLGLWEGQAFTDRADWYFELGLDAHSIVADPQFVDIDGVDNVIGSSDYGLEASYYANTDLSGTPVYTKTVSTIGFSAAIQGLPTDYFSIRWQGFVYIPQAGSYTFYEQADDGMRLYLNNNPTPVIDQWTYVNFAERSYTTTFTSAGWVPIRIDYNETFGGAGLNFSWSGPGITKQAIVPQYLSRSNNPVIGDFGADDDFHLLNSSPAVDSGDPSSIYLQEIQPNGGRIDIGAYGNTSQANISPLQIVQVLSPNGFEKFEQGQVVPVSFRTAGLQQYQTSVLLNGGASTVGAWAAAGTYSPR
ncbi:MAG: right-handed parallel beta-helix repeat-containing protein, partial [Pirellula sp.]